MFLGEKNVYGLCEKVNGQYQLVRKSDVNHQDVLSFATKNDCKNFCKKNNIPYNHIVRYGNRFEKLWAICWSNQLAEVWVHTINNFNERL